MDSKATMTIAVMTVLAVAAVQVAFAQPSTSLSRGPYTTLLVKYCQKNAGGRTTNTLGECPGHSEKSPTFEEKTCTVYRNETTKQLVNKDCPQEVFQQFQQRV